MINHYHQNYSLNAHNNGMLPFFHLLSNYDFDFDSLGLLQ